MTNSLFQSAAQNLLVADEAIDVFTITGSNFPRPKEWIFEEGEQVIVSSEKERTIAVVKSTHLEVDLATNEDIKALQGLLPWGFRQRHEWSIKRNEGLD